MSTRSWWVGALLLVAATARAETLTLEPSADATLFQVSGGNPETADSQGPHLFVGRIATGLRRRALLRFDVTTLPADAIIDHARLELSVSRTVSGNVVVNLHRVLTPWREGSANAGTPGGQGTVPGVDDPTWSLSAFPSTAWTLLGGDVVATPSASFTLDGEARYSLPATESMRADLAAWRSNAAVNVGWALISDETQTPPTAKRLESSEAADPSTRPRLVIDYHLPRTPVPVTGAYAALLLALAVVAAARFTLRSR